LQVLLIKGQVDHFDLIVTLLIVTDCISDNRRQSVQFILRPRLVDRFRSAVISNHVLINTIHHYRHRQPFDRAHGVDNVLDRFIELVISYCSFGGIILVALGVLASLILGLAGGLGSFFASDL